MIVTGGATLQLLSKNFISPRYQVKLWKIYNDFDNPKQHRGGI